MEMGMGIGKGTRKRKGDGKQGKGKTVMVVMMMMMLMIMLMDRGVGLEAYIKIHTIAEQAKKANRMPMTAPRLRTGKLRELTVRHM